MGIFKTITFISLLFCQVFVLENKNHILYLMQAKEYEKAISNYEKLYQETKKQDFEILQQMAIILLEAGAKSPNSAERQLTMYGSGLAASDKLLKILEKGLFAPEMPIQLTALHFICAFQENAANDLLIKAMGSDFLETRIEAAYQMAIKKHPCAFGQIDSLMQKMPVFFKPFFPQFFGIIGTSDAIVELKNLLFDRDPNVCIQSILSIAQNKRDDLLYLLRKKLNHSSIGEKEAATYSLAHLNDSSSINMIQANTLSTSEYLQLASFSALYDLGDKSAAKNISKMAAGGSLFAICSLGKIPGSENLLAKIATSPDEQERINASIALLMLKDERCIKGLKELLIKDSNSLIQPFYSVGHSLICYHIVPYSAQRKDIDPALSLDIKERFLQEALELKEESFLSLASYIFDNSQNELIAPLVHLLGNLKSEKVISFLKTYAQKSGAPLIRDYCNLALYRANEPGPYFDHLQKWIKRNCKKELIRLKPFTSNKVRFEKSQYELSSEEASRLMIEIFSSVAEKHDQEGIMLLLYAIKNGPMLNRYPLAGILLRATE